MIALCRLARQQRGAAPYSIRSPRACRAAALDGVRVCIDGVDGVGKTVFHNPRAVRHSRGRSSPEGFWLDTYDYTALRRRVLDPFGPGGSRR
jgi:uridine kinase